MTSQTRTIVTLLGVAAGLLFVGSTLAQAPDARGWSTGTPAAAAGRVLAPLEKEIVLDLPNSLQSTLAGPTLLVYFSPTCPHCQAAAPELDALATRLAGRAEVVGVATGHQTREQIDQFTHDYQVSFRIVHDTDGKIARVLGADSTPSAVLVTPVKNGAKVVDFWYPYVQGFDTLVEMRLLDDPWAAFRPDEYQGVSTCAACHIQETEAWALSHHSIAWPTLVMRDKHTDAACTGCHVTGNGRPTGFDGDPDSVMVNVGCESCHGPGGPHDGTSTEPRTTCGECHDEDHSIAFRYEKGLPLLDHFRTAAMDDPAYLEARKALFQGEVPRRLLAFEPGATSGAEACRSCHASQHEQWAGSPHGKAMATLNAETAADPECVKCHATAKESGPAESELAAFRVDEGVGCESCHGPGDRHVASGGAEGTIEGLGEDCPVCVIEAVCTSCHTPEWDPDWDLDAELPKVGH